MSFQYDDGGRKAAGFKGNAGDCVTRAISIATEIPYKTVYGEIDFYIKMLRHRNKTVRHSSARTGVVRKVYDRYLESLGWEWTPTMKVGQGCKVHLRSDELPEGRLIVRLSHHLVAVIDGVTHDTFDCSRNGTRCVYGYYHLGSVESQKQTS